MFYPDPVDGRKKSRMYRMLSKIKDISYHSDPGRPHDFHIFWSYTGHSIVPDEITLSSPNVINRGCWDISKEKVNRIFDDLFVDPTTHRGLCVEKADLQGRHDKHSVIECPAPKKEGYVYQKYIESKDDRGYVAYRIHYACGIKMIDKRHKKDVFISPYAREVVNTRDYFSEQAERDLIKRCDEFGFHYGEIDFLMDGGKPVVIDVNNVVGANDPRDAESIKIFCDFLSKMGGIRQVRVARSVKSFRRGLMDRWGLKKYHNINAPCYFFGIFNKKDIAAVKKHKGFKLIHFINARGDQFIDRLKGVPDMVIIGNPYLTKTEGHNIKWVANDELHLFEIKDFSVFKPNTLGDKIYLYQCNNYDKDMAEEIQKRIDFEIIYGIPQQLGMKELKADYYDKSFLNINLSPTGGGGMTTVTELGLMGRMTIMNTKIKRKSIISYKNIDEVVEIINRESKKIGTVQPAMNPHNTGEEWMQIKFWK